MELATKIVIFLLHFRCTDFTTDRFILREFLCSHNQLHFEIGNGAFQFGNGFLGLLQELFELSFLFLLHNKFLRSRNKCLIILSFQRHLGG